MTDKPAPKPKRAPAKAKKPAAPKPKAARAAKGSIVAKLDAVGIDRVCELIEDGASLRQVARDIGVLRESLSQWLAADPSRSARAREARESAAESCDDRAFEILTAAKAESGSIAKAREQAQHLRWRASKIAPKTYGDRVAVDATVEVADMTDETLKGRLRGLLGLDGSDDAKG